MSSSKDDISFSKDEVVNLLSLVEKASPRLAEHFKNSEKLLEKNDQLIQQIEHDHFVVKGTTDKKSKQTVLTDTDKKLSVLNSNMNEMTTEYEKLAKEAERLSQAV